jgi:PTH2 family peptidyl-tRNA hydrolase
MDTKQVIVIRKDLNMRKGKMVAQGGHGIVGSIMKKSVRRDNVKIDKVGYGTTITIVMKEDDPLLSWFDKSFKKICVSVNSEEELIDIYNQAKEAKLPCTLIEDNGLTEFNGVKTKTCVAIGPYWSEDIDKITKELPLL